MLKPIRMLNAPDSWLELLSDLGSLVSQREKGQGALLIGIDGRDGCGKSSLGYWLAWQLGIATIDFDLFLVRSAALPTWRLEDINRALAKRLDDERRDLIVSSILLLKVLDAIKRLPGVLVFVERGWNTGSLGTWIDSYIEAYGPHLKADFHVRWSDQPPRVRGRGTLDKNGFDQTLWSERATFRNRTGS